MYPHSTRIAGHRVALSTPRSWRWRVLPLRGLRAAKHSQVNMGGKFLTLTTEVVGLHTIEAGAGVGVEVNTDKDSIGVAIGDICAAPERDN